MKPLLVVQTGDPVPSVLASRGPFAQHIEEAIGDAWTSGYAIVDVRSEAPPDPTRFAGLVITGSASNVPDRDPWVVSVEAWLREVVAARVPTLGICFGHQLLGQALGGDVRKNPRGREMGTITIERLADDPLFEGAPARFDANATHVDAVVVPPPGSVVLARSSLDDHQALRHTPTTYSVQFHPEMDAFIMRQYIAARRDVLAGEGFDVDAMLAGVRDAPFAAAVLRRFVRVLVAPSTGPGAAARARPS